MFKTPADYLDLFLIQGVLFSNDIIVPNGVLNKQGKNSPDQEVAKKIKDYSEFLIDLLLQYNRLKFPCLIIAASIIVSARRILGIEPCWNPQLEIIF